MQSQSILVLSRPDELQRALAVQNDVYMAAAKLVTKVGGGQLAWIAADRAATAAARAESPNLRASAAYQLICAFLKLDRIDEAEQIAIGAAENIVVRNPLPGLPLGQSFRFPREPAYRAARRDQAGGPGA